MKRMCWDIETEGLPLAQIEKLMPDFAAGGNVKDPAKIAAQIAEKKAACLDTTALRAITGRIVAVTLCKGNVEPEFHAIGPDADEQTLIGLMLAELKGCIALSENAYAWNGSGFDLLFLCQRAAVYGIPAFRDLTTNVRGKFYWNEYLIDPKMVWANYSPDHTGTSLKSVAMALGVGEKTDNGKDFAALLKTNPEEAKSYATNDVLLLRAIVERMGI